MEIKTVIKSQYLAALEMLKQVIEKCPESLWADPVYKNQFWHVAYHMLFYTHLYLQPTEADFVPWEKHQENYNFMGPTPWPPHEPPVIDEPYNREDVLAYVAHCQAQVKTVVDGLNLEGESGFDWLPMSKLELQFYSIRHLMLHTGELAERIGQAADQDVDWVGMIAVD
ncbi:MAG: DinB family protein [Chloroflexi bacterium]|nr:DinB family protein [Chloroflexota bacterium]